MKSAYDHYYHRRLCPPARRAFTLVELMVTMTIMAIIMTAVSSAMILTVHAIPDKDDVAVVRRGKLAILEKIAGELTYATALTEHTDTAVEFSVADRGHGAVGPEVIRYEWSGTAGDPLTRQYNGGTVVAVFAKVRDFKLTYAQSTLPFRGLPRVLFVLKNAGGAAATGPEKALLESWGYTVQIIDDSDTADNFDAAMSVNDVALVNHSVESAALSGKLRAAPIGVVIESAPTYNAMGVAQNDTWFGEDSFNILDNTHEITSIFPLGMLTIATSNQNFVATRQALAPGAVVLADDGFYGYPALVVVDGDGDLYGGGQAVARRVTLPWGEPGSFGFSSLNSDAHNLLRRALAWAAAPVVYTTVRVSLESDGDATNDESIEVDLLNRPSANR